MLIIIFLNVHKNFFINNQRCKLQFYISLMKNKLFGVFLISTLVLPLTTTFSAPKINQNSLSIPQISSQEVVSLLYENQTLYIEGLTGVGTIKIYTIIGNEIASYNNVYLSDFQTSIDLERKTMYIVRVITNNEVKTYKLVAR